MINDTCIKYRWFIEPKLGESKESIIAKSNENETN